MQCPKCGFEQPDSPDCARCGIVISKFRAAAAAAPPAADGPDHAPASPSSLPASLRPPPSPPPRSQTQVAASAGPASGRAARQQLSAGTILGETFSIYFANFIPFTLIAALSLSPLALMVVWFASLPPGQADKTTFIAAVIATVLLTLMAFPVTTAAVTYGVFAQLRGDHAGIGHCLSVGLSSLLPVLGVALLQGLLVGLGLAFCLIPGLILGAMYGVAVPVAVEERPGATAALARSATLTDGYRWTVFGVFFVINFIDGVLDRALPGLLPGGVGQWLSLGKDVVAMGLTATAGAVLYYRLRSLDESVDVRDLRSIFE